MTAVWWGIALGVGANLVLAWWFARTPSLAQRVSPHVRASVNDELRGSSVALTPFPVVERLLAPVIRDGARMLERAMGSDRDLRLRLARSGTGLSVEHFRAQQVMAGAAGLAAGAVASVLLASVRNSPPMSLVALTLAAALGGVVLRDVALSRVIERRSARIEVELPTVAELLAMSVGAGESVAGAIERVTRVTAGVVSQELASVLASSKAGTPLTEALRAMGDRSAVEALRRFADAIATAVERGTPLADVMRAQARDVRDAGQRALMEEGGKREIAMMVPVVFLILPVTVVFAVFPGLATIRWGL